MTERQTVGMRIRRARELRSWGQAELARAVGISATSMWKIEQGQQSPRPATVRRIAEVLSVDVTELTGLG